MWCAAAAPPRVLLACALCRGAPFCVGCQCPWWTLHGQGVSGPSLTGNCAGYAGAVARVAANCVTLSYTCIQTSQSSTDLSSERTMQDRNVLTTHAVMQQVRGFAYVLANERDFVYCSGGSSM